MDNSWRTAGELLLIAGSLVIVQGGLVLVIWSMRRRTRAMRSPVIEAEYAKAGFKVAISRLNGCPQVTGEHQGIPFVLAFNLPGRFSPPPTVVSVQGASGDDFEISQQGSRDLSGRDLVDQTFPDTRAREAVRRLFGLSFDTVELRRGTLSAVRHFQPAELLDLPALRMVIEQLTVLRAISCAQKKNS